MTKKKHEEILKKVHESYRDVIKGIDERNYMYKKDYGNRMYWAGFIQGIFVTVLILIAIGVLVYL